MDLAETLSRVVDDIMAAGPSEFAQGRSLVGLHRDLNRLGTLFIEATGEFDRWGEWGNDGAKSAAAWISQELNEPIKVSRRRVRQGRALRELPLVAEALREGRLNESHLDILLNARNPRTKETMARDEALLVEQAEKLDFGDFSRSVAYWEQLADPDGAEEDAMAQRERRDAYFVPTIDGMYLGKSTLDPITGAIVADEHARLEQELFEADWAEAKARLGHEPLVGDLVRTPAQRRADALMEMAIRSRTAPVDGRRPAPLISVFIDYPTFRGLGGDDRGRICQLSNGVVITPGCLLPWLTEAYIERAVFRPDGRVEVSETARFFTGATRRALELRDQRCTHPYCDEPIERCQGDHVIEFARGGPSTQENGRLLCAFHNRLRNQRPPPDD
jgi:hypothetical protein